MVIIELLEGCCGYAGHISEDVLSDLNCPDIDIRKGIVCKAFGNLDAGRQDAITMQGSEEIGYIVELKTHKTGCCIVQS
jgi:hypothetical protein